MTECARRISTMVVFGVLMAVALVLWLTSRGTARRGDSQTVASAPDEIQAPRVWAEWKPVAAPRTAPVSLGERLSRDSGFELKPSGPHETGTGPMDPLRRHEPGISEASTTKPRPQETEPTQSDATPRLPAPVTQVLEARAFNLRTAYRTDWRKERPRVEAATVVALKVDPALVRPRELAEPVLYVGDQVAERVNRGHPSGIVVAIVPGQVDFEKDLIWFGDPDLPERVDAEMIRRQQESAVAAGIQAIGKITTVEDRVEGALAVLKGRRDLLGQAGVMIRKHAPDEEQLGRRLSALKDE